WPGFVQVGLAMEASGGAAAWPKAEVAKTPTRSRHGRRNEVMAIGIPRQKNDFSRRSIWALCRRGGSGSRYTIANDRVPTKRVFISDRRGAISASRPARDSVNATPVQRA